MQGEKVIFRDLNLKPSCTVMAEITLRPFFFFSMSCNLYLHTAGVCKSILFMSGFLLELRTSKKFLPPQTLSAIIQLCLHYYNCITIRSKPNNSDDNADGNNSIVLSSESDNKRC